MVALAPSGSIPQPFGVIERPRLLEKLETVPSHRLTLISAPPGYGKTTLAAQFARRTSLPVVWHSVEERERDVPSLHQHCLDVLGTLFPGIEAIRDPGSNTPAELAALVSDYLRRSGGDDDVVYIIDDLQRLMGSPAAEQWLRTLVETAPANCHLMLISRALPNLPLTELIARREVLAISQDHLRFTANEVLELANTLTGALPDETTFRQMTRRLEGWPAGTVLALQPLPRDLEQAMLEGGEGPEALFNALANLMLDAQPYDLREFLLTSSTLVRITPELCSKVLGITDSARWLAMARSRNLFLSQVPGGVAYHQLFRDFLQQKLYDLDSKRFVLLHKRAADWFEAESRIEDAFDHCMSSNLKQRAAAIADDITHIFFTQGKVETLLSWRAQLGDVRAPELAYTCAMIHTDRFQYEDADAALEDASAHFKAAQNEIGLIKVALQRAKIDQENGRFQIAARQADKLLEHPEIPQNLLGRALHIVGFCNFRMGNVEAAIDDLEKVLFLYQEAGYAFAESQVLQDLELAYARAGRLEDASQCLQRLVALRRKMGRNAALARALNNLGFHYHRMGRYRDAVDTFKEGLSIISRVPDKRAESYLLWSMGDLQRDMGCYEDAAQFYSRALELGSHSDMFLRCNLLLNAAILWRWQGWLNRAVSDSYEANRLAADHDLLTEKVIAEAEVLLARQHLGQHQDKGDSLAEHAAVLRQQGTLTELVQVLALSAHLALVQGDFKRAERHLAEAAELGAERGGLHVLAAEIINTPTLDRFFQDTGKYHQALYDVVEKLRQVHVRPNVPATSVDNGVMDTTYTLTVKTLGHFSMERDGHIVDMKAWRATRAREIFLYLLFNGSQTREAISLLFWPDSSSQAVRSNFHTTLHRARRALGDNTILFEQDRYFLNPDVEIKCDALQIMQWVEEARLLSSRQPHTEELWQRIAALYQGEFLANLDGEWIVSWRENLHEMYIEALLGLGDCGQVREDYEAALGAYERVLFEDPYREKAYLEMIRCYVFTGKREKGLALFRKMRAIFFEELGVEPSEETIQQAKSLLGI